MDAPICPNCNGFIPNNQTPGAYPGAISRKDNKTEICSDCGVYEAMVQAFGKERVDAMKKSDGCPVCLLNCYDRCGTPVDSMDNHEYDGCNHLICINCLTKLRDIEHTQCPVCRGDITELLETLDD